ncbi:hypothetical protein KKA13_04065, partial [Patescibacteria group bacterium]|nr:hypothetical protein [Patescibacteria group bacterium]MBU1613168.1 hypothetical protein [Patescibacteria group bacterium]
MLDVNIYFREAVKNKASDVHLVGNELPMIRIEGELRDLGNEKLSDEELRAGIAQILSKEQQAKFAEEM